MAAAVRKYWRAALVSLVLAAVLGGAVAFCWRLLTTPFHGTSSTTKLAIASLTLLGVVVTTLGSLIGLSLKQSIDRRTVEIAQAEHKRQQMETALQTVRLLTLDSGSAAPATQISAALLVLARLDEVTLALDLAAEMWPKEQVTSTAATRLIDCALATADPALHRDATLLLYNNFQRLDKEGNQYEWPTCLERWPRTLDDEARRTLVRALANWAANHGPGQPDDLRHKLLREARQDKDAMIKEVAAQAISALP